MLRSKARKSGTQTSHYRGVSLLKQTGKWHAQINVGGKQVTTSQLVQVLIGHDHIADSSCRLAQRIQHSGLM